MTNGLWFSYPGYNEMFSGVADPRVDSNDKVPNPNVTVLEWLNTRPGFEGRVAAFGSWDVLPFIVNAGRSHIPVGSGFTPVPSAKTERERAINELATDLPAYWDYGPFDAPMVYAALESLRTTKPRVLYIMLGEGDEWAHAGKYELYLDAALRSDRFIERVWNTLQAIPRYANQTTLLVTTDHGRGATTADWTDHGTKVPAAEIDLDGCPRSRHRSARCPRRRSRSRPRSSRRRSPRWWARTSAARSQLPRHACRSTAELTPRPSSAFRVVERRVMFLARRPSEQAIDRFVASHSGAPLLRSGRTCPRLRRWDYDFDETS